MGDDEEYETAEFYANLARDGDRIILEHRYGLSYIFESLSDGGKLLAIVDRNDNSINFEYFDGETIIADPFGREVTVAYEDEKISEITDYSDRTWVYKYEDDLLSSVIQPSEPRTKVEYKYDDEGRLKTITNPRGQIFLENNYDSEGRVSEQNHGEGTYNFEYEPVGEAEDGSLIYRTSVAEEVEDKSNIHLQHNSTGQVVERIAVVSAESSAGRRSGNG